MWGYLLLELSTQLTVVGRWLFFLCTNYLWLCHFVATEYSGKGKMMLHHVAHMWWEIPAI